MKVFLDIDGVMVHANPTRRVEFDVDGFYKFNSSAIIALKHICIHNSSIELIISSSHRFRYSTQEWKNIFFSRGLEFKEISRIETQINYGQSRKTEILNWINKCHFNWNDLLIIDDDKSLNGLPIDLKKRLILTNPYIGLNESLINEIYGCKKSHVYRNPRITKKRG